MAENPRRGRYQRLLGSDPEADAQDEMETHLALRVAELKRQGRTEAEARARAEREFGDMARIRREMNRLGRKRRRRQRRAASWVALGQDIRYAMRVLRASPGFASVVVLTLALGIGGTIAVFSVVQAVLLAPLPYEQPGQLVRFYMQHQDDPSRRHGLSRPHFRELRDHVASFEDVAALYSTFDTGLDLIRDGRAERIRVLAVTSEYFRTLRPGPLLGRAFERDEEAGPDRVVGAPRVVLSDRLWRTRFDGDPSVIGTTIRLSAEPYEVVGIAPHDPIVGDEVDAWLPFNLARESGEDDFFLTAVGRLRDGVNIEQARAELATLHESLAERWPNTREMAIAAVPLKENLVADSRAPLRLLLIAVGLVLLLVCVNVANLVLVRATGRAHEFAIRAALGSGGLRIARQLLVESVLLAVLSGLLGLGLAVLGVGVLQAIGRDAIARLDEVGFDPVVLGFAVLVTLTTAIAFGVAPAVRFARIDPNRTLGQQSRSATGARGLGRLRGGLAAAQLALALTLLAGAGVLIASFYRLGQVNLGFRVERVLTFDLNLPDARYDGERRAAFQEELARRVRAIRGAEAAGGTSRLPGAGSVHLWGTRIESGPLAGTWLSSPGPQARTVSGAFFEALEIPLLAGRTFEAQDDARAPARAVVSASVARRAFPGVPFEEVVGQRIAPLGREREIIGVVGDVTLDPHGTLAGRPAWFVYFAHRQFADNRNWALAQVVATELPPERILPAVRAEVAALDPELVVHNVAPMTEVVGRGVSRERFALVLMGAFAAVALTLAALGLYGVLAYMVRLRTQEIGIRIALGATAAHVRVLVLRQAATVVGIGLVAGIGGALVLGRWLSSLVFEISPSDPRILVATALLLTITAFLSAWLPVRRASQVDPRIAMQEA
ncbi:MAG: ADOP family duplicated permease [Longimicrobiales bacterium]